MRTLRILAGFAMLLFLSGCGPFESLNPLYTQKDLVSDPLLAATWIPDDRDLPSLSFFSRADASYAAVMSGTNKETGEIEHVNFDAHLFQLNGIVFLDLVPKQVPIDLASDLTFSLRLQRLGSQSASVNHPLTKVGDMLYMQIVPDVTTNNSSTLDLDIGGNDRAADSYQVKFVPTHWLFKVSIESDTLRLTYLDEDWFRALSDDEKAEIGYEEDTGIVMGSTNALQDLILRHGNDDGVFAPNTTLEFHRQI